MLRSVFVSFKSLAFTCTLGSFERNDSDPGRCHFRPRDVQGIAWRHAELVGQREQAPVRHFGLGQVEVGDQRELAELSKAGVANPCVVDFQLLQLRKPAKMGHPRVAHLGFAQTKVFQISQARNRLESRVVDRRPDSLERLESNQMPDRFEARDLRVPQVQFLESSEAAQISQTRVREVLTLQVQLLELRQSLEGGQVGVSQWIRGQHELLEILHPREMDQARPSHGGLLEVQLSSTW